MQELEIIIRGKPKSGKSTAAAAIANALAKVTWGGVVLQDGQEGPSIDQFINRSLGDTKVVIRTEQKKAD